MSAAKSPRKSRPRQGVAVDATLRGKGPKKGAPNAGRPPDKFKRRMQAMGSSPKLLAHVTAVLNDRTHPDWSRIVGMVWDRAYGKAAQSVDVTSGGETLQSFTLGTGTA